MSYDRSLIPAYGTRLNIPDEEIVKRVVATLESQADPKAPMTLATIGHRLSAFFRRPFRDILGDRKLKALIESGASGTIVLEGPGDRLQARLSNQPRAISLSPKLRYDPAFWAAFAKPIREGQRRILKRDRPFEFRDSEDGAPIPDGWIVIEPELISAIDMEKVDRENAITSSIQRWCTNNQLDHYGFADQRSSLGNRPQTREPDISALHLLLQLIEKIPEEKRKQHNLSLDLLRDLLKDSG